MTYRAATLGLSGFALWLAFAGQVEAQRRDMPVPERTVIALYETDDVQRARYSRVHQSAQMPLNHLGLNVVFRDVADGLPSKAEIAAAHGLLTWFDNPDAIPDPPGYVDLLQHAAETGTKYVLLGQPGFRLTDAGDEGRRALRRLGIDWTGNRVQVTFDSALVHATPVVTGFERDLPRPLPPFPLVRPSSPTAETWISVRSGGGRESHVVMTSPTGGFAADGYALHVDNPEEGPALRAWLIDPFRFFARAFERDAQPKPDPTTRFGRRVYYSHIDGDGWLNRTRIERYRPGSGPPPMAAAVIHREILQAYPQLPVTVAPIAAELDPDWFGTPKSRRIARAIFALPNVDVGNHTFSHPFAWDFFAQPDHRARERPLFDKYPGADRLVGPLGRLRSALGLSRAREAGFGDIAGYRNYERPRAFALQPFSPDLEIDAAREVIAALAPPGKPVATYQWSGNTAPFAEMVAAVDRSGMVNINGGDSRYDPEYPSYAWSAPLGIDVDGHWQVFASNSNENTYTKNWTGRYFGFRNLIETLRNENRPRRVSAFNVYYHMYSGELEASLTALTRNLEYALSRPLTPVTTSTYARSVQGFRTVRFRPDGPDRWTVSNRGALQTIRFDRALFKAVDFGRSRGVIGQRRLHGALYIALDPAVEQPVVALRAGAVPDHAPAAGQAYLIESAWAVRKLTHKGESFRFRAGGFLDGSMRWSVPDDRPREVMVETDGAPPSRFTVHPDGEGTIAFRLGDRVAGAWPKGPVRVTVTAGGA